MDVIGSLHESICILSDDEFLVCRDYENLDRRIICADACLCVSAVGKVVLLRVYLDAEEFQAFSCTESYVLAHLAHSCSEDDCIDSSEESCIGTDVLLESSAFHVDAELSLLVAIFGHL